MESTIKNIGMVRDHMDYIKSILYDRGIIIMLYKPEQGVHKIYPKFVKNIFADKPISVKCLLQASKSFKLLKEPEVVLMYPKGGNPKEFLRLRIIKDEGSTTIPEGSTLK